MKKKRNGFTLIELMVVMSIIAVLSVLMVAAIRTAQMAARNTKRLGDAKALQNILAGYYSRNQSYVPGGWHDFSWCPGIDNDPVQNGTCSGLLITLINNGYLSREIAKQNSGEILYCRTSASSYKLWVRKEPASWGYPGSPSDCSDTIYPGNTDLSLN